MRTLTRQEITTLENQGCSSTNWNDLLVEETFTPEHIRETRFSGKIALHSDVHIFNSTLISTSHSTFGQGIEVNVLDETGGRSVLVHSGLTSQSAYIQCLWRYHHAAVENLRNLIRKSVESSLTDTMTIGKGTSICDCRHVSDVQVGDNATLIAIDYLEDGTVLHDAQIGPSVIGRHFIVSPFSTVTDAAQLDYVFVGQGVKIGGGFTAEHSLFFTGCEMFHGEACAYFGGPFSVSHHKNTLLIACMTSFFNAGSGSNFSNHLYKSGPIHYGILRRGCKMASDAHLIFPSHIAPFTTLFNEPKPFQNTSKQPFSYLSPKGVKEGINLFRLSPYRDQDKWRKRHAKFDQGKKDSDLLHFDILSPYTIGLIRERANDNDYYRAILYIYVAQYVQKGRATDLDQWVDVGGMMTSHHVMVTCMRQLADGKIDALDDFYEQLKRIYEDYDNLNAQYATSLACQLLDKEEITDEEILTLRDMARPYREQRDKAVLDDARKEYTFPISSITFGLDGTENDSENEKSQLRGSLNEDHIRQLLKS